jgi:hypothetical protein
MISCLITYSTQYSQVVWYLRVIPVGGTWLEGWNIGDERKCLAPMNLGDSLLGFAPATFAKEMEELGWLCWVVLGKSGYRRVHACGRCERETDIGVAVKAR